MTRVAYSASARASPVTVVAGGSVGASDGCQRQPEGSALEGDRARGAIFDGLLDLGAEVFGGAILQDREEAFIVHFEDLGRFSHAHRMSFAQIEVDFDLHQESFQ